QYFLAGVQELWLIDARKQRLKFAIHRRGKNGFVTVAGDKNGYCHSAVLGADYRLERRRDRKGWPLYQLHEQVADRKGKR
ncbi:MAG TPA: hypothetical protein VGI75_02665, partial [Pirellulales bacterium]